MHKEIHNDVRDKYYCKGHIGTQTHIQHENGAYAGVQGKEGI